MINKDLKNIVRFKDSRIEEKNSTLVSVLILIIAFLLGAWALDIAAQIRG